MELLKGCENGLDMAKKWLRILSWSSCFGILMDSGNSNEMKWWTLASCENYWHILEAINSLQSCFLFILTLHKKSSWPFQISLLTPMLTYDSQIPLPPLL